MFIETLTECCSTVIAVFDGIYGSYVEATALLFFILVFNFLAKWVLKRLHLRYEKQNKIWKDAFVKALHLPLSYYVWFFAFVHLVNIVAARVQERIAVPYLHMILSVGVVIAFAWFLMRWKKYVVQSMMQEPGRRKASLDPGKIAALDKVATVAIGFFTLLTLLEVTNHSISALIAFGGIGGLALAFASQEIIANFFGGVMIYFNQPFTVGDWIHLPEKNIEGIVEDIGWYMTRIRSLDKRPIYIPNSIFSKIVVITPSRMSHRQIKEVIGLRSEDLPKIRAIISEMKSMLQHHAEVDRNQSIIVNLAALGPSSIDIAFSAFTAATDTSNFMRIKEDILFKISDILIKYDAQMASGQTSHQITLINTAQATYDEGSE